MFWALLVISILLNVALIYSSYVTLKKLEQFEDITEGYEATILRFYDESSKILKTSRSLDKREMFEKDDEVGQLFEQLIDTIGGLRKLIYVTEEETENIEG